MQDLAKIKRNVAKMVSQNAPESDIDAYISSEGTSIDAVRNYRDEQLSPEVETIRQKNMASAMNQSASPFARAVQSVTQYGEQPLEWMKQGARQFVGNNEPFNPVAGGANIAAGGGAMLGVPFGAVSEGIKSIPQSPLSPNIAGLQKVNELIGSAAGTVSEWGGNEFSKAAQVLTKLLPFYSPEQKQQLVEASGRVGSVAAPIVAGEAIAKAPPAIARGLRGAVKPMAEPLMSHALNTKFETLELEKRYSQAAFEEGLTIRPGYYGSRQRLSEIKGRIDEGVGKLNTVVDQMQNAGVSEPTQGVLNGAKQWLSEKYSGLKSADKGRYIKILNDLSKDFLENNPEKMTPKDMQSMKQASQARSNYGEFEQGVADNFNKAVAYQLRSKLEKWNTELTGSNDLSQINRRLGNLSVLSDIYEAHGLKGTTQVPAGLGSMPFYIAVSEPVRGTILSVSRATVKNPRLLSYVAQKAYGKQTAGYPSVPKPIQIIPPNRQLAPSAIVTPAPPDASGIRLPIGTEYMSKGAGNRLLPPATTRFFGEYQDRNYRTTTPENLQTPYQADIGAVTSKGKYPIDENKLKAIVEQGGAKYRGIGNMGKGGTWVFFDEPIEGNTLAVSLNQLNPQIVKSKVAQYANKKGQPRPPKK